MKILPCWAIGLCSLFIISLPRYATSQQLLPCRAYYLDLSTGVDQEANQPYSNGQSDAFWRIAQGPVAHGPYPHCAQVNACTSNDVLFGASRCISSGNGLLQGNMLFNVNNCNYTDQPFVLERDFMVSTQHTNGVNAFFNIERLSVNFSISSIVLSGPGGPFVLFGACLGTGVHNFPLQQITLFNGQYTLQIHVGNEWLNGNQPSPMFLRMKAFVFANEKIFQDNKHFGKNAICSPPYPPFHAPVLANTCVMAGDSMCEVIIDNYQSDVQYSVNQTALSSFTFNALLNSCYTLTATDNTGCTQSATFCVDTCLIHAASFRFLVEGLTQQDGTLTPMLYNLGLSNDSNDVDDVVIEFRQAQFPYALQFTGTGRWKKDGSVYCSFPPIKSNFSYHVLRYKNGLRAWSSSSKLLCSGAWFDYSVAGSLLSDFKTLNSGYIGLCSGDINQDGLIDIFDYFELEEALLGNGNSSLSDLNGDGLCDMYDVLLLEANVIAGMSSSGP